MTVFSAWLIHFYTASGAVAAFLGVIAVLDERYRDAFLWMVVATLIDATDGWLARRLAVRERVPAIDGARLDDIVDYLTFVFLPVLLLYRAEVLPVGWGVGVAAAVLLSSACGFAAVDAKTDDHFFTGFPSYWNIVALYLVAAGLSPAVNALVLLILSGLVFWRVRYVYPTRTPILRPVTIGLGAVWSVMVVGIILMLPNVPALLLLASLFFPVYYTGLSLVLNVQQRAQRSQEGRRQPA
jgi:phosphatidylcholine synthase